MSKQTTKMRITGATMKAIQVSQEYMQEALAHLAVGPVGFRYVDIRRETLTPEVLLSSPEDTTPTVVFLEGSLDGLNGDYTCLSTVHLKPDLFDEGVWYPTMVDIHLSSKATTSAVTGIPRFHELYEKTFPATL